METEETDENKLSCFICKKSEGKLILLSEETLKKCQTVLKVRKKHNLKYANIILPDEYTDGGYHRECHKTFTGVNKQYYNSEPADLKKKKRVNKKSFSVDNSSPDTPVVPELTTELATKSPTPSDQTLFSELIELQPSTSAEQSHSSPQHTELSAISQSTLTSESEVLQSTSYQKNPEISKPDVDEVNDAIEDVNTQPENVGSSNDSPIVCIFCNKRKKKVRSKMLPLHAAETNQFKGSIFSNIEGLEEFDEFLTTLNNYFAPKIYYHTDCRVHFNNDVSSKKNHLVKVIGITIESITDKFLPRLAALSKKILLKKDDVIC